MNIAQIELFLICSNMIQRYEFLNAREGEKISEDGKFGLTLQPNDFEMKLKLRKGVL